MPQDSGAVIVRNYIPLFFWGVIGFFLGGCVMMTWLGLTGEIPEGEPPWKFWSVVAFFWAGGLFAGRMVFTMPVTILKMDPARISLHHYYPVCKRTTLYCHADIADFRLLEATDSDGDPYFKANMHTRTGQEHTIAEGHSRDATNAIVEKCQNALINAKHISE